MWQPVPDGYEYHCQCADCTDDDGTWQHRIYANRDEVGVGYADGSESDRYVHLPDDVRLCRLVSDDEADLARWRDYEATIALLREQLREARRPLRVHSGPNL